MRACLAASSAAMRASSSARRSCSSSQRRVSTASARHSQLDMEVGVISLSGSSAQNRSFSSSSALLSFFFFSLDMNLKNEMLSSTLRVLSYSSEISCWPKLVSRMAMNRLSTRKLPITRSSTKYSADEFPLAAMPSYITAFQSSPVSTWNTVTSAQSRVSKLWRGTSPSSRPHILPPNSCIPSSAKMKIARKTMNEKFPRSSTVRYTVYRKFCSDVQLRISFRTRRMRNARSAESDPEPAAASSMMLMSTTAASNRLNRSAAYSLNPSPPTFSTSSMMNEIVRTRLQISSARA